MKTTILTFCLAALAGQATALSCLPPDPIDRFQQASAAEEGYYVLYGQLDFDEAELPTHVSDNLSHDPAPIAAEFKGKSLTADGFTNDYVAPAMLKVNCIASWCGSARSGVDALYFVRADSAPVVMLAEACGGMIFERPSEAVLDALTLCMQGGECSPQPFK